MMAVTIPTMVFQPPRDEHEELGARADRVRFLDVPERRFLSVDGSGRPGGPEFQAAMGALYPVAYTLHFALKRRGTAARVGVLEGLYWIEGVEAITPERLEAADPAHPMCWRLMLRVPEPAPADDIAAAIEEVRRRKTPSALEQLRVVAWREGPSAQILHMGPYAEEAPTIARLHAAITEAGLRPRGHHHEIYLGDPNRVLPERLRTLLRQPVTTITS